MTISRREFLKQAYRIGGIAALYSLGGSKLVDECLGGNYFISGHVGAVAGDWADWDEIDEAGWGDTTNVNITIYDGGANADETGGGIVTGADRVHTQVGSVGAAVNDGGYYYRPLDGANDAFTVTDTWGAIFAGETKYGLIVKCYLDSTDLECLVNIQHDPNFRLMMRQNDNKLKYYFDDSDNAGVENGPTGGIGDIDNMVGYACMWTDGTVSRGGFCVGGAGSGINGQPTKWSDFAVAQRIQAAALYDNLGAPTLANNAFGRSSAAEAYTKGRIYYVLAWKGIDLIDNAA